MRPGTKRGHAQSPTYGKVMAICSCERAMSSPVKKHATRQSEPAVFGMVELGSGGGSGDADAQGSA
eukprot:2999838-Rhodomonas_salina.1